VLHRFLACSHKEDFTTTMRDDDELKPGVDKPTRLQYIIGVIVILVFSLVTYWWLTRR
jgi:hypothetical protein